MATERSHGKARTILPRSSDLLSVPQPEPKPTAKRGSDGRFAPGNTVGRGKGAKKALAQLMGVDTSNPVVKFVGAVATQTYRAHLDEMPNRGSIVSSLVAMAARHEALSGYFHAEGCRLGLGSPDGLKALENASKQSQRAERLLVTALDISKALASRKPVEALDILDAYMPAD